MDHRERVLMSINREEPDRIPLDLWGSAYSLTDYVYFGVKKELNIQGDINPFRRNRLSNYYDERVLEALDIDFRHVRMTTSKPSSKFSQNGTFTDAWGVVNLLEEHSVVAVSHPLANAEIDDLETYPWPNLYSVDDERIFLQRARHFREKTDCAVMARTPTSLGIIETCCALRGTEQFLIDLVTDKSFAHRLLQKVSTVYENTYTLMLREAGRYIDIVQYAADYGTQSSLFISPKTYQDMLKPYDAKVVARIRELTPDAKIMFHSCGAIFPLIPDLIEIGYDILNPLQPLAVGMDSRRIKENFGNQICFHGGIDVQHSLPGTTEDVRREVEERISALAPGGGYILAPANDVLSDVPAKNVVLLYRLARELGRYPLALG